MSGPASRRYAIVLAEAVVDGSGNGIESENEKADVHGDANITLCAVAETRICASYRLPSTRSSSFCIFTVSWSSSFLGSRLPCTHNLPHVRSPADTVPRSGSAPHPARPVRP